LFYPVILVLMETQPGAYVPCDPDVANGVHMIRGKADLYNMIIINVRLEPACGCRSRLGGGGQHHDTCVAFSQPDLILGADHSMALYSPDLCHLHGQGIAFRGVDGRSYRRYHYFLASGYIGGSANDGERFCTADIDPGKL